MVQDYPLHEAVEDQEVDDVRELLEENGSELISQHNSEGLTPLHAAVEQMDDEPETKEIIDMLLAHKDVDVNARITPSEEHMQELKNKAESDRPEIRDMSTVSAKYSEIGDTVLGYFARNSARDYYTEEDQYTKTAGEFAKQLIAKGADVNSQGGNGNTALHLAIKENRSDLVEVLLENGADTEIKNDEGKTPKDMVHVDKNLKKDIDYRKEHLEEWLKDDNDFGQKTKEYIQQNESRYADQVAIQKAFQETLRASTPIALEESLSQSQAAKDMGISALEGNVIERITSFASSEDLPNIRRTTKAGYDKASEAQKSFAKQIEAQREQKKDSGLSKD